jgi:iron complex transport system permease protein
MTRKSDGKSNAGFARNTAVLSCILLAGFLASFLIGRYAIPLKTVIDILLSPLTGITPYWEETLATVILRVRLPRILLALMVGGALSLSGAAYQTLFKNPLVSPDILGVSAGAGFGAALAMIFRASWWEIQLFAFVAGIAAVMISYLISRLFGRQEITVLILAGIVVSSLFQALLSIVKTLADTENALPSITFWLMGSLGRVSGREVLFMLPAMALSGGMLFFFRYQIDTLSAGEDEAAAMGVNVPLVKTIVIISSTLMTVSAVSICGIIGWIGLVVPHIARTLAGARFSRIALMSLLAGGCFLLLIDDIIRGIEGVELPLGVLTALAGTPVFVALLSRIHRRWQ